jgi:hypothetical protein
MLPPHGDDSPCADIHTPLEQMIVPDLIKQMWNALHDTVMQAPWEDVVMTQRLHAGFFDSVLGPEWFRFRLRNMRPMSSVPSRHFQTITYSIEDCQRREVKPRPDGNFTLFHMVPTRNLISPHQNAPGSSGILIDGGMNNGCQHGDGVGVYGYAAPPTELFGLNDGWSMLELKVRPCLTRVKGGSHGRYVLKSDQTAGSIGAPCTDCEVMAIFHFYSTLPSFLKF